MGFFFTSFYQYVMAFRLRQELLVSLFFWFWVMWGWGETENYLARCRASPAVASPRIEPIHHNTQDQQRDQLLDSIKSIILRLANYSDAILMRRLKCKPNPFSQPTECQQSNQVPMHHVPPSHPSQQNTNASKLNSSKSVHPIYHVQS